jgi:uncharacterized membrane protein required for colicin V production
MVLADIIILVVLLGFAAYGWKSGLISVVGRIAGVFVGAFMAGQYYSELSGYFTKISFNSETLQNAIAFIVIFGVISQLAGVVFYALDKLFNVVAIIPGLKSINRLAGAVLGAVEGALILAVFFYIAYLFPFSTSLEQFIVDSQWAHFFLELSQIIAPFVPDSLQAAKDFIF